MASDTALGWIGLGNMGAPMAKRLIHAGYPLTVWNRSVDKTEALVSAGAGAAASPAEVARASDVIFLSLSDTAAVEAVVLGPQGVKDGADKSKILVDTSSIAPASSRDMAMRLAEETGMRWIDAPVSGGVVGAEEGSLVFMAGGAPEDIDAIRPIIDHLGQRLTHMGPSGAGQTTKVCNQMIVGGTIAVVAETLKFAAEAGVDAGRLPDCLAGGFADSTVLQVHARRMIEADLAPRGGVRLMLKDMETACDLAGEAGASVPMTGLATELYRLLIEQGHDNVDQSGLIRLYADGPL